MGTWNWGPFDNDTAWDTVRHLADGTFRMDQFRFDCEASRLDTEQLQVLIALAAVINGHVPCAELDGARAYEFSFKDRRWIEARVKEALQPGRSELYGMWEDAGELEQWLEVTSKAVL